MRMMLPMSTQLERTRRRAARRMTRVANTLEALEAFLDAVDQPLPATLETHAVAAAPQATRMPGQARPIFRLVRVLGFRAARWGRRWLSAWRTWRE